MAVFSLKVLLVIGVLVGFAAFYARPVYPKEVSNRGLKTIVNFTFKFIGAMSAMSGYLGFSPLNTTRAMMNAMKAMDVKSPKVERHMTTMDGVEVIIFKPTGQTEGLRPGIIHIHGGGWVLMTAELYGKFTEAVVEETGSIIASVNYRLAPEYVYPIPLEDCLTAARYFLRHAKEYGVDENLIGIKGDSAGGNLAMAVALKLSKEKDLPGLKFMSLDYPALQAFDFQLPCYKKHENGPGLLTKQAMVSYWLLYAFGNLDNYDIFYNNKHLTTELQNSVYRSYIDKTFIPTSIAGIDHDITEETAGGKDNANVQIPQEMIKIITDPLYAPLMASDEDLSVLPTAYIFNVEFDVLRDDGLIVAERLKRAGVKVTTRFMSFEEHGYLNFVSQDKSVRQEIIRFAKFFNETLNL